MDANGRPQNPPTTSAGTKVYNSEIDPALKDIARQQILNTVKGNGLEPDDVKITKFDGETLEFLASTQLELQYKHTIKHQTGKVTGPKLLSNTKAFEEETNKEIHKIAHSHDVIDRIHQAVLSREDKGINLDNIKIRLPFLHKDFVVHEACKPCNAKGRITCQRCAGKGQESCPRCYGRGTDSCSTCGGRQYIQGPNNQNQQCMHCNGTGRTSCNNCNEAKYVSCSSCNGQTNITCQQCNGHAYNSVICMAEINPVARYNIPRNEIPQQMLEKIDTLGTNIQHHADIEIIRRSAEMEREHDDITLLYHMKIPMAHIEFSLKSLNVPALLFGTQGRLYDTGNFLEKITVSGIKSLKRAALGQGNVATLLKEAGQYRTLRTIILDTSRMNAKKAHQKALRDNPHGLSEKTAKKLIAMSRKALLILTKKPKQIGGIIGLVTACTAGAVYVLAGRKILSTHIPLENAQITADIIAITTSAILGYIASTLFIKLSLKKSITSILDKSE